MNEFSENRKLLMDVALKHAAEMLHEPEGFLSCPYIDPGGPYSRTLWDWDSFWASRALLGIAEKIENPAQAEEFNVLARDTWRRGVGVVRVTNSSPRPEERALHRFGALFVT